jgi:hypothetical protein
LVPTRVVISPAGRYTPPFVEQANVLERVQVSSVLGVAAEAAEKIAERIPNVNLERTELKFQDARNYRVSGEKACATFGFSPKLTVSDGIREIKELTEQGRICDIYNTRYSNAEYLRPLIKRDNSPLGFEVVPDYQKKTAA